MTQPQLFQCFRYADAEAALTFMAALGFTERLVVRDGDAIVHAQLKWRDNGGVMLGSRRDDDLASYYGTGVCNLVVEDDAAVDATIARAVDAGARLVQEPKNPPHGGRSGAVADPEGNLWNIDSYPGE